MSVIEQLIAIAEKEVGTREEGGNNQGDRIEVYQQATWLPVGPWPWCAAFTAWCLGEWVQSQVVRDAIGFRDESHAEGWRCKDASAFGWEKWARKKHLLVLPETERAKAGDFVIFDFSHIGLVVEDQAVGGAGKIHTIEGNTNGRGDRDSESGDGVWRKQRHWSLIKSLVRVPL